eukprot:252875-Rhodomonas_salina.2
MRPQHPARPIRYFSTGHCVASAYQVPRIAYGAPPPTINQTLEHNLRQECLCFGRFCFVSQSRQAGIRERTWRVEHSFGNPPLLLAPPAPPIYTLQLVLQMFDPSGSTIARRQYQTASTLQPLASTTHPLPVQKERYAPTRA